jgi:hypothetical protein
LGYSLVVSKRTEAIATSTQAPLKQFVRSQNLLTLINRTVVVPNNDTLYASDWLDLSQKPIVVRVPDTNGRYFTIQLQDAYTNTFGYIGTRTTDNQGGAQIGTNCLLLQGNCHQQMHSGH